MIQSLILAFYFVVNAPNFHITNQEKVVQEKATVMAASEGQESDEENTYRKYEIVPLNEGLQRYIWEECQKFGISYELMLAIAYTESRFNPKAVSNDGSSKGLFQINTRNTMKFLAEQTEIKRPNAFNPYHSAKMAVFYVSYLKQKYLEQGYDEESVIKRVLLAYRFGMNKSKRKSLNHPYVKAVLNYKYQLESGEIN